MRAPCTRLLGGKACSARSDLRRNDRRRDRGVARAHGARRRRLGEGVARGGAGTRRARARGSRRMKTVLFAAMISLLGALGGTPFLIRPFRRPAVGTRLRGDWGDTGR